MSAFPDELYQAPRSWTEKAYPKLIYYNKLDKGGHFAAWEQPELLRDGDARGVQVAAVISKRDRMLMRRVAADLAGRDPGAAPSARRPGSRSPTPREALPMASAPARLPVEGDFPSLAGATAWLNSPPLTPESLRGKVVLVDIWTYTCINWLRTLPYVRAWAAKYKDQGLVVIGVHSPEFEFEKDLDNVRRAVKDMGIVYPVAVDSDHAVWRAFDNEYWPALYLVDAKGQIRYHQFGEGEYERTERGHPAAADRGRRDRRRPRARDGRSPWPGGGGRLEQPEVRGELRRLRAHRGLRLPRRRGSRRSRTSTPARRAAAQPVGALGQLDAGTAGGRLERAQRARSPTAFTRAISIS